MTLPIPHLAGGKAMMLAEAFVSGGLINAALVHLSLGSVKNLEVIRSQGKIHDLIYAHITGTLNFGLRRILTSCLN